MIFWVGYFFYFAILIVFLSLKRVREACMN